MTQKALVTGGGGFLGSCIALKLRERGDQVLVLGRGRYEHLRDAGIDCVQADIRDAQAVRRACRDVDVVFHVAALPGIWGPRRDYWSINVEGTRNVLGGCRAESVGRLVYTSSPSVVFGGAEQCGVDESKGYPERYLAHYPHTKAVAERDVLAANSDTMLTVALRPHLIWGPGDRHLIPRILARARAGKLVQVGDGTNLVDITYVDNAAEAHLRAADALKSGAACGGRAYFISQGRPVNLWSWMNDVLGRAGLPPVRRRISLGAAYAAGAVLEFAYRLLRRRGEPPMTRFLALQLAQSHYFDISAAKRDFNYEPAVSTSEGLERMFASFQSTTANASAQGAFSPAFQRGKA